MAAVGYVRTVRGNVVDVRFEMRRLPSRYLALRAGSEGRVVREVQMHLDGQTVRTIALSSHPFITRLCRWNSKSPRQAYSRPD